MTEPKDDDGRNKYLVFEWDDIRDADLKVQEKLAFVEGYLQTQRHFQGKKDTEYFVLNLDDEINVLSLRYATGETRHKEIMSSRYERRPFKPIKIRDIVKDIVEAITSARESRHD